MNERKQNEILEKIDQLKWQVDLLNTVHLRLLSEVKRRNDLIDDLLQDQDKSDWWKNGGNPEWD